MISRVQPERAPNGDFGGRSFQGVNGPPTSLRGGPVPFPGAPNEPGSEIGEPNVMRDTAGRRSNVTIQYSRVVPMGSKLQKLETKALKPGVLAWTSDDEHMQKRSGRGVERMYKLTSWNWLQAEDTLAPLPTDTAIAAKHPPREASEQKGGKRQRHALREGGITEAALHLTPKAVGVFALDAERNDSPFLMWKGWSGGTPRTPLRSTGELGGGVGVRPVEYEDLVKVKLLWNLIYETDVDDDYYKSLEKEGLISEVSQGLLSKDVMGTYKPDGFVLYKYSTEGMDSVAEDELDRAQNGLFNIVVGGHAMVTSWAVFDHLSEPDQGTTPDGGTSSDKKGKSVKRLVTLPRDTLFIVVKGRWALTEGGDGWFVDLRYVRSTSEELMKNSKNRLDSTTNVALASNEIVLGAWRIGSVIDSAASRTRPSTFASAPTTPAQTMGLTVSVGIRWVTSYALHDMFHHKEPVYEASQEKGGEEEGEEVGGSGFSFGE